MEQTLIAGKFLRSMCAAATLYFKYNGRYKPFCCTNIMLGTVTEKER
jgi:hypothetical protein